jgi:hypothetical protein
MSDSSSSAEGPLVDVARTIGATLGTVAATVKKARRLATGRAPRRIGRKARAAGSRVRRALKRNRASGRRGARHIERKARSAGQRARAGAKRSLKAARRRASKR